eukprot:scaffold4731_cov175-Ochromonas_danica.AAC.17
MDIYSKSLLPYDDVVHCYTIQKLKAILPEAVTEQEGMISLPSLSSENTSPDLGIGPCTFRFR